MNYNLQITASRIMLPTHPKMPTSQSLEPVNMPMAKRGVEVAHEIKVAKQLTLK